MPAPPSVKPDEAVRCIEETDLTARLVTLIVAAAVNEALEPDRATDESDIGALLVQRIPPPHAP
jgi:hypothetical protein